LFDIVRKIPKALWIVVIAHGVTDLSAGALLVALPFLKAKFALTYASYLHSSEIYASSLLTVYLATSALGTLLGGTMSDRYGSKRVMIYSILPISVLLYLFPIVGDIGAFVVLSLASILLSATVTSSLVLAQRMMPNNVGMASGLTIGLSVGLGAMEYWLWER